MLGDSFRQGDRSEYLALYFLSALGVAVHVPRPEDIGADFQCVLANRDGDVLTFKAPFLVQTKSSAPNLKISYGRYDNEKQLWPVHEINWLWSQESWAVFAAGWNTAFVLWVGLLIYLTGTCPTCKTPFPQRKRHRRRGS